MKSRVYYGEYSLDEWVRYLISGDIEIPPYQRNFVWDKDEVSDLIKAFKDNNFVPPITICKSIGADLKDHHYIVDGQQRLTSILMFKYDFFYKKSKDEEWTLTNLLRNVGSTENIEKKIKECIEKDVTHYARFTDISLNNKKSFFEDTFLGFSYIVLEQEDSNDTEDNSKIMDRYLIEQQSYYAKLFNDINTKGQELEGIESRKAYYFINKKYENLFNLKFNNIDFVRYLAVLSNYDMNKKSSKGKQDIQIDKSARGIRQMEQFIIEYIEDMSKEKIDKYTKIYMIFNQDTIDNNNYESDSKVKKLKQYLSEKDKLFEFKDSDSIIDKDVKLFGLIYEILFNNKDISKEKISELKDELAKKIKEIHSDKNVEKNPNANKWLNSRVSESINIYEKFSK